MAIHCEDYEALLRSLREQCAGISSRLIGIDGVMQTGKTPLADTLAADLGGRAVHCDDHHPGTGSPYVERLDVEAVRTAILNTNGPVIIDAICLLDVLDRLERVADCLVYVFPQDPCAIDNDWLDDDIPFDQILTDLKNKKIDAPALVQEIVVYTKTRRPQDHANFTFRWSAEEDRHT